jgi:hypothetical protein
MGIPKTNFWNKVETSKDSSRPCSIILYVIFKAGINFSSTRRALQYILNSKRKKVLTHFFLNSSPPPTLAPRTNFTTELISEKKSIQWNRSLGSLKFKFGLYIVSLFQQIGKIPVTETMLIAILGEANFLHCS